VTTTGNSGKVFINADPLDDTKTNDFYIDVGSGRTSSSPAPVANGTAFAVGLDGGFQGYGELRIYYLDDILGEDGDGKVIKVSDNARVAESLPSGLVASFCADGDMLYFGDSDSNVYAYNTSTRTGWVNTANSGTFSNRSPALTASRVYFPVTNYGSPDAQGKLLAIDRYTGQTVYALPMEYQGQNLGRAMTAPVVLRAPNSAAGILIGTGLGYLNIVIPFTGTTDAAFAISDVTVASRYASGVSGEISAWENIAVTTSEQGMIVWQIKPAGNLKAVSIDLGVPAGQKAEPGAEYTATVVFENESDQAYPGTPVAVLHGSDFATLYDETGNVLPKKTIGGREVQVADFGKKGEPNARRTFTCKWHPFVVSKDGLTGIVNHDEIGKVHQETTYEDNKVQAETGVMLINLKVTDITLSSDSGMPGEEVTAVITVLNESERGFANVETLWRVRHADDETVLAEGTVTADFAPGEAKQFTVSFKPDRSGLYRVAAMANPNGTNPPNEINFLNGDWPGDNRMEVSYEAIEPCTDISVTVGADEVGIESGQSVTVSAIVRRANDGPNRAVPVEITVTSSYGGSKSGTLYIEKGGTATFDVKYKLNYNGEVRFTAEAWPSGLEDCRFGNNEDSISIYVEESIEVERKNRGTWVEVIS